MPGRGQDVLDSGRKRDPVIRPGGSGGNPVTLVALVLLVLGGYFFIKHGRSGLTGVEKSMQELVAGTTESSEPQAAGARGEPAMTGSPSRPMIPCSMVGRWQVRFGDRDLGQIDLEASGRFDFSGSRGGWSVIDHEGGYAIAWDYGPGSARRNEVNPLHGGPDPEGFTLTETDGNTTAWKRVQSAEARYCDDWDYSTAP